jgi:hypothetical protein
VEQLFNLAWLLLASAVVCLWFGCGPRTGVSRRKQYVALAVLALILFPVISITDDLLAAQNPAEADCCLRRDHVVASAHSIVPPVSAAPQPGFREPSFSSLWLAAPSGPAILSVDLPGLSVVQNRPPPLA